MRTLTIETITASEEETIDLGARLGRALRPGAVVGLTGPLGAGKTRLVQGIVRGAGYDGRVRSPTFALMHLYNGDLPVRHFDLYRLESIDDGTAGEWEEAMDGPGISLIEWADRIPGLLPDRAVWISLQPEGTDRRRILLRMPLPTHAVGDWRVLA